MIPKPNQISNQQPTTSNLATKASSAPSGAGNPSADPLQGTFMPAQAESMLIAGGTTVPDPVIGTVSGGLPEIFSIATGVTSSIASKMYEEALMTTYNFSSTTVRGHLLGEVNFDPFSASCVNPAANLYASVHKNFVGSICVTYEVVSNSSLQGRIAIAYVPESFGATATITPEQLFLYEHVILDVSQPGRSSIIMKPTTTSQFVVQKGDGKFYGKLVCIAFTNIANTYGTTMDIPLNLYSKLMPESHYSVFQMPTDAPSITYAPDFPKTISATLITEAQESVLNGAFVRNPFDKPQVGGFREVIDGQQRVFWKTSNGGVPDTEGTIMYGWADTYHEAGMKTKEQELALWTEKPPVYDDLGFCTLDLEENFDYAYYTDNRIMYDLTSEAKTLKFFYNHETLDQQVTTTPINKWAEYVTQDILFPTDTGYKEAGALLVRMPWVNPTFGPNFFTVERDLVSDAALTAPTIVSCSKGRLNGSQAAPLGYRAVRILDPEQQIIPVKTGVVGETTSYGETFSTFFYGCMRYLQTRPDIGSLTYSLSYVNGDHILDLLVNRKGMWTSSTGLEPYSFFLGELGYVQHQVVPNTNEWIVLPKANAEYFESRTLTLQLKPQMMAAIVGGTMQGIGKGLGTHAEMKWANKDREDRQAFQQAMLGQQNRFKTFNDLEQAVLRVAGSNYLAQNAYDRKVSSQVADYTTTQSRSMREAEDEPPPSYDDMQREKSMMEGNTQRPVQPPTETDREYRRRTGEIRSFDENAATHAAAQATPSYDDYSLYGDDYERSQVSRMGDAHYDSEGDEDLAPLDGPSPFKRRGPTRQPRPVPGPSQISRSQPGRQPVRKPSLPKSAPPPVTPSGLNIVGVSHK